MFYKICVKKSGSPFCVLIFFAFVPGTFWTLNDFRPAAFLTFLSKNSKQFVFSGTFLPDKDGFFLKGLQFYWPCFGQWLLFFFHFLVFLIKPKSSFYFLITRDTVFLDAFASKAIVFILRLGFFYKFLFCYQAVFDCKPFLKKLLIRLIWCLTFSFSF